MTKLSFPVGMGPKSKNLGTDVKTIQELLNRIVPDQGGPAPPLKVDGICGPKTQNAIQRFQLKHFGWPGADGRVDPTGPTLGKMDAVAKPAKPTAAGPVQVLAVLVFQAGIKEWVDNDYTDFFFRFKDQIRAQAALYYFVPNPGSGALFVPKVFTPKGDLFAMLSPRDIRDLGGDASYTTIYEGDKPKVSSLGIQGAYGFRSVLLHTHLPRGWADKYHGFDGVYGRNKQPDREEIRGRLTFHSMEG
jgi:hypothetical protein